MLRVAYQRVTLSSVRPRFAFVARDAVVAIEELDPLSGAANTMLHFAGGLKLPILETSAELFESPE